jgi:hypothetical protein
MDFEAAAEYHRRNDANRQFVKETRLLERSDLEAAVVRYRRAIDALCECRDMARTKGLERYGFTLNQTDAAPIDRLTLCLVKMGRANEAAAELDRFAALFPLTRGMALLERAKARVARGLELPRAAHPTRIE